MDDEKPFDLRDRIALEVLNGLISNNRVNNDLAEEIMKYLGDQHASPIMKYLGDQHASPQRVEKIIRNCYKVADIMRKVRLSTFE